MDEKIPAGLPEADQCTGESRRKTIVRVLILLMLVYGFLLAIKMMGGGLKLIAQEHTDSIRNFVESFSANPVVALFIGVVITAVVQSSSFTTVLVVSLVVPQEINGELRQILTVQQAIPLIMGANIGTTITNTLVSMGHVSRRDEFRRAFSGAVVHDIFNLMCVAILFPIEMAWHPMQRAVEAMVPGAIEGIGSKVPSVLDYICKPVIKWVESLLMNGCHLGITPTGIIVASIATVLLFVCLGFMVKQLKKLVLVRLERFFDRVLFRNGFISFFVGLFMTFMVQSSSVTTSLAVPLLGAGLLTLEQIFPYTVGANIGTTITAMLAALASGSKESMKIALVHSMFNCAGAAMFLPLRFVPIGIARHIGHEVEKHRWYAFVHLGIVFIVIPAVAITLGYLIGFGSGSTP